MVFTPDAEAGGDEAGDASKDSGVDNEHLRGLFGAVDQRYHGVLAMEGRGEGAGVGVVCFDDFDGRVGGVFEGGFGGGAG